MNKPCKFSFDQIKNKVMELYPSMDELEVNYHAYHVEDNDWLKVSDSVNDLEQTIKEQVENLNL